MRIGLVLGAGGVQGGAWLTGALDALAAETRWDPASANYIVGTSAGSMIGTLLAAGIPPWFMVAHSEGEEFEGMTDARGNPTAEADRSGGAIFRISPGALPLFPGSLPLVIRSLIRPRRHTPAGVLAGWLPRGIVSGDALRDIVKRSVAGTWTEHPNHWVVACDYANGRRVSFGRAGAPRAKVADAVAASCAIPGFYQPVRISGRRYVDGGIWSTSNLDVVRGLSLDLVICLNPTSTLHPLRVANPVEAVRLLTSHEAGRRLGSEARKLREEGTRVALVQPTKRDLDTMGVNLMSSRNRNEVIRVARETTASQLADPVLSELVADLPAGDPDAIRRPTSPASEWPSLTELAERVRPAATV